MRVNRKIYSGSVLEQEIYIVSDRVRDFGKAAPGCPRFATEEERELHKSKISKRRLVRMINHNCNPGWYYATLTLDNENEVHTFAEARRLRDRYIRRLQRLNPDLKAFIFMGRGKNTERIHFHLLVFGVSEEQLKEKWTFGMVTHCAHLREHNKYNGVDHGRDYTGLAEYLFNHWTKEQGERSHRWKATRNIRLPEPEKAVEVRRARGYSPAHPPMTPKGYILVGYERNGFGYQRFIYVIDPKNTKQPPGRPSKEQAPSM